MSAYDHKHIERKWQDTWEHDRPFRALDDTKREKYYCLIEFPYPSGEGLHVGHVRSYTALDVIARKRRAEGKNVLYPIGWDAFGLPTENYAVKTGIHPKEVTKQNTDNYRSQLKSLGFSFDWDREVNTSDPDYYKWTQWIFIELFKKGLAYKARTAINWCPSCKIGLANEEVVLGKCERCGGPTEKRDKEQWMLRITDYAERLLKDLDTVDYPERVKAQQQNWIGRSEGALIEFPISNFQFPIRIFTTRPDTIFGATYLVIAPEHELISKIKDQRSNTQIKIQNLADVDAYVQAARKRTDIERIAEGKEKTGVRLEGVMAVNPATTEEMPIYVADYVLGSVGTGAIMAVPAHDERDYAFAKRFRLPVTCVIEPETGISQPNEKRRNSIVAVVENPKDGTVLCLDWTKKYGGTLLIGGGIAEGETPEETARRKVREETGYKNLKLVQVSGKTHHHYFSHSKDVAMHTDVVGVHFELIDCAMDTQALESDEHERFSVKWLSKANALQVIEDENHALLLRQFVFDQPYTGYGILADSGAMSGLQSQDAIPKTIKAFGKTFVTYKLRDWVFSRQRYWGEPIPLVFCEACKKRAEETRNKKQETNRSRGELVNPGWVPVRESELPVVLPDVEDFKPTDDGTSPLAKATNWVRTTCPQCGGTATRETEVMPNWAGSSWYYLAYTMRGISNFQFPISKYASVLRYWLPVDWYNGGMEHTTLHLLYSRFWHKALFDMGHVPTAEPYAKRTSHGLILALDGQKMSKSRGNVVNPDELVERFGADAFRIYEMFMGHFEDSISWNTDGVVGAYRFIEKVWRIGTRIKSQELGIKGDDAQVAIAHSETTALVHRTIKKVGEDIEAMKFNTAISALMVFANHLDKLEAPPRPAFEALVRLVAPFAPHVSEELWEILGHENSVHEELWPSHDETFSKEASREIVISVNGKVRGKLPGGQRLERDALEADALAIPAVARALSGKHVARIVHIEGKLVNIVSKD